MHSGDVQRGYNHRAAAALVLHRPELLFARDVLALRRHAPRRRRRGLVRSLVRGGQERPRRHVGDGCLEAAARDLDSGHGHGSDAGLHGLDRQGHRVGIVNGDAPVALRRDAHHAKVDETHLRYVVANPGRFPPFSEHRARHRVSRVLGRGVAIPRCVTGRVLCDHGGGNHGRRFRRRLGPHLGLVRVEAGELSVVHLDGYLQRGKVGVKLERRGEDDVLVLRRVLDSERREGMAGADDLPTREVLHLKAANLLVIGGRQRAGDLGGLLVTLGNLSLRLGVLRVLVGPRRSIHDANGVESDRGPEVVQDTHRVGDSREGLASSRGRQERHLRFVPAQFTVLNLGPVRHLDGNVRVAGPDQERSHADTLQLPRVDELNHGLFGVRLQDVPLRVLDSQGRIRGTKRDVHHSDRLRSAIEERHRLPQPVQPPRRDAEIDLVRGPEHAAVCRVELHRHVQLVPLHDVVYIVRFALCPVEHKLDGSLVATGVRGEELHGEDNLAALRRQLPDGAGETPDPAPARVVRLLHDSLVLLVELILRLEILYAGRPERDGVIGGERLHQLDRR